MVRGLRSLLLGSFVTVVFVAGVSDTVHSGTPVERKGRPAQKESSAEKARQRQQELKKLEEVVRSLGGKPHHARIILTAGKEFDIDPVLLASLAHVESHFKPRAASKKGARGLMQLRPVVTKVLGVTDPWDPYQNIMAGAAYLRNCFDRYARDPRSTYLALAAYNVGPGPADKLTGSDSGERFVKKVLKVYNRVTDCPVSLENMKGPAPRKSPAFAEFLVFGSN